MDKITSFRNMIYFFRKLSVRSGEYNSHNDAIVHPGAKKLL